MKGENIMRKILIFTLFVSFLAPLTAVADECTQGEETTQKAKCDRKRFGMTQAGRRVSKQVGCADEWMQGEKCQQPGTDCPRNPTNRSRLLCARTGTLLFHLTDLALSDRTTARGGSERPRSTRRYHGRARRDVRGPLQRLVRRPAAAGSVCGRVGAGARRGRR